jgi:hypothetical protein
LTEEAAGVHEFWANEFDLSALSYPQFLDFFFDRPIVGDDKDYDLFRDGIDKFIASNPSIVVSHVQAMCRSFSELSATYSPEKLNQGLWAVFGAAISCEQYLFDSTVDLGSRISCIDSMYQPFRDLVASSAIDKHESFYWMWWDIILHTFWQQAGENSYSALSPDQKQILEGMYQTLLRILTLNHRGCQWSALHGLGHLHHPRGPEVVQRYLDVHRDELTGQEVRWIESCRDGTNA